MALVAILAAMFMPGSSPMIGVAEAKPCANAGANAKRATENQLRRAVMCLINKRRASGKVRTLRGNKRLRRAATRHNNRMVRTNCFSHRCPGEADHVQRAVSTGYTKGAKRFQIGETIACDRTPRRIVRQWMSSNRHRQVVISPTYRDFGVAVRKGRPGRKVCPKGPAITVTTVLGWRR